MIAFSAPFPPLSWWAIALQQQKVVLDHAEHYQKMSYRNRYYLAAPEGKLMLSIPLVNGRNQRVSMEKVRIDNKLDWQTQHWRTIISLYNRSPFFQYFEHRIYPLFHQEYELLTEFNFAGIRLINELLDFKIDWNLTNEYHTHYPNLVDIRQRLLPNKKPVTETILEQALPEYYQVFSDRSGFLPDCSILDLLFCEALQAKLLLQPK